MLSRTSRRCTGSARSQSPSRTGGERPRGQRLHAEGFAQPGRIALRIGRARAAAREQQLQRGQAGRLRRLEQPGDHQFYVHGNSITRVRLAARCLARILYWSRSKRSRRAPSSSSGTSDSDFAVPR